MMVRLLCILLLTLGAGFASASSLDAEIQEFEERLADDPDDTGTRWELSFLYQEAGELEKARENLEFILRQGIVGASLWDDYFSLVERLDQADAMIATHEQSNDAFSTELLAQYYLRKSEFAKAEVQLRKILDDKPRDRDTLDVLGQVLIRQKKYDAARDLIEGLVQEHPEVFEHYRNLARIALMEGRDDLAERSLRRYLNHRSRASSYRTIVEFLFDSGKYDLALTFIDEARRNDAASYLLSQFALKIYLLDEDYQRWVETILQATRMYEGSWRYVQEHIRETASCEECLADIEGVLVDERFTRNPEAQLVLAAVRYSRNRLTESVASFRKALRLENIPPSIVGSFVRKLRNDGEAEQALAILDAYQASMRGTFAQLWTVQWERFRLLAALGRNGQALREVRKVLIEDKDELPAVAGVPYAEMALRMFQVQLSLNTQGYLPDVQPAVDELRRIVGGEAFKDAFQAAQGNFQVAESLAEAYLDALSFTGAIDRVYEESFFVLLRRGQTWSLYPQHLRQMEGLFRVGPHARNFRKLERHLGGLSFRRGSALSELTGTIIGETLDRYHRLLEQALEMAVIDARLLRREFSSAQRLVNSLDDKDGDWTQGLTYRTGLLHILEEQPDKTVDLYREYVLRFPEGAQSTEVLFLLDLVKRFGMDLPRELSRLTHAWYLWEHNQTRDALTRLESLLQMTEPSPIQADAFILAALIEFQRGDFNAARNAMKRLQEEFPTSPQLGFVHYLERLIAEKQGRPTDDLPEMDDQIAQTSWYLWARSLGEGRVKLEYHLRGVGSSGHVLP